MEAYSWVAVIVVMLFGIFLGRRRSKPVKELEQSTPSVNHEVELVIDQDDLISETIAEHDVDPETVRRAIELADKRRY